jgi:hypothetical protein
VRRPSHNASFRNDVNGKLATGETGGAIAAQDEEIRAVARSEYWLVRWRESQKEPRGWRLSLPDGSAPRGGQSTLIRRVSISWPRSTVSWLKNACISWDWSVECGDHRRKSQRRCRRGQCVNKLGDVVRMQAVVVHERRVVVHASHVISVERVRSHLDQSCGCDGPQRVGTCADCPSDSLPASVDFEYLCRIR